MRDVCLMDGVVWSARHTHSWFGAKTVVGVHYMVRVTPETREWGVPSRGGKMGWPVSTCVGPHEK